LPFTVKQESWNKYLGVEKLVAWVTKLAF
jgi:hypothetical protein